MSTISQSAHPRSALQLIVPIAGYVSMIAYAVAVLADPLSHVDFLYSIGIFLFVSEFIGIHSSVLFMGAGSVKKNIPLAAFYGVFLFGFAFALGVPLLGLLAFLTIVAKIFSARYMTVTQNAAQRTSFIFLNVLTFMGTLFLVLFLAPVIQAVLPLPAEVLAHRDPNSSGIFVDAPQVNVVWVIVYFATLIVTTVQMPKIMEWIQSKTQRKQQPPTHIE